MSGKYDFPLDMESDNSNSLILRNILPDSDVLEIGCAHGRMTKHLKETLNARVTIVELDEKAGACAARYAQDARHIGSKGDIERAEWHETLHSEPLRFDAIIMADILEHLRDPWRVMSRVRDLLKPQGAIWISVPNIAHNAVLIELLNGRFDYRNVGLLDSTHIRFFTANSLESLVAQAGLCVARRLDPKQTVGATEFKNSYNDVPWYVARYLRRRPLGEVYQFVWQLRPVHAASPGDVNRFGASEPVGRVSVQ